MSKTIIYSILGVSVIAVAAISVNSLELGPTDLDFENLLGQGQTVEDNPLAEANYSEQLDQSQGGVNSDNVTENNTKLFNQNKINTLDNQRNRESDKNLSLKQKLNAKVKDLQFKKAHKQINQSKVNNKVTNSSVALSTSEAAEELAAGNPGSTAATLNPAGVVGIVDGVDSDDTADGTDTADTTEEDDTTAESDTNDDVSSDAEDVGLTGKWRGRLEANLREGCVGALFDFDIPKLRGQENYGLFGSVKTDSGKPYSIRGTVTQTGSLNANLSNILPGFGLSNYRVSFSGTLSETQGSGTWSDSLDCSGSWTVSKV